MEANAVRDFQRMINPDESELVRHARTGEVDGTKEYPPLLTHGLADPDLSSDQRTSLGRMHPNFMGGEYLPDREDEEVEIARITIASTTHDVTSLYARRGKNKIYYRVVDEYGGDTLNNPTRTSTKPLTLKQLTEFFLNSWSLIDCLDCNFGSDGYPRDQVHSFIVDASSNFYAEFGTYVHFLVNEWLDTKGTQDE